MSSAPQSLENLADRHMRLAPRQVELEDAIAETVVVDVLRGRCEAPTLLAREILARLREVKEARCATK